MLIRVDNAAGQVMTLHVGFDLLHQNDLIEHPLAKGHFGFIQNSLCLEYLGQDHTLTPGFRQGADAMVQPARISRGLHLQSIS